MGDPQPDTGELGREQEFSRIISSYLSAVDGGERPDREAILKKSPHLADRLRSFFAGEDELGGLRTRAAPPLEEDGAGELQKDLGDYELLSEIARGGMGVVYRARQKSLKRVVALKMIVGGYLANDEVVRRFRREAEAVARLDHPNIVPIYEIGEHEGQHYFSMKLFEGGSLLDQRERLREEPRLAAEMIKTVAWAIHYAHLSGILHRDLKPANVLLDAAGRPCVADFGLARAITSEASLSLTDTGAILGTPLYMAPEQATGEKAIWGPGMDIYSLGAMLYELLTGRPPFRGATPVDILRAVIEDEPPPARSVHPKTPIDLQTICAKCLEKDPSRRYESAAALAGDLERFLRHETILARPPGLLRRACKAAVRHRVAAAAIVVAVIVTLTFSAAAWYRAERRFEETLGAATRAYREGNLDEAERFLYLLQEGYGSGGPVKDLARGISGKMRELASDLRLDYLNRRDRDVELKTRWEDAKREKLPWQPPWERSEELAAWSEYTAAREGIEKRYNDALQLLRRAERVAPPDSAELTEVKLALGKLLLEKYREGRRFGAAAVTPDFFRKEILSLRLEELDQELGEGGTVSFETDPPGAEVHCFRYESFEGRLLPLPFDPTAGAESPQAGLLGAPYLEVERVWSLKLSPFAEGDRWETVGGTAVGLVGDLARVLKDVGADESVEVIVRRNGARTTIAWTPFPRRLYTSDDHPNLVPGRLVNVATQFGFSFAGYPLDFARGARVGISAADSTLSVALPRGSYLFVFRKEGFRDTRYPVAIPRTARRDRVRLLKESEFPEGDGEYGFVYIPAGLFVHGGDGDAFQSMELGEEYVEDFFLARHEVTVGEYLQFVNDAEIFSRTDEEGRLKPTLQAVRDELPHGVDGVQIIPREGLRKLGNGWTVDTPLTTLQPVSDIPQLAAVEYAHWLTRKRDDGWRYRLPTDLEWEKAARGVDRRTFVWGNYFFWTYCWSFNFERYLGKTDETKTRHPALRGIVSTDESVYGVRDLAGSLGEMTADRPRAYYRYRSIRGGDWWNPDAFYLRVATRNARWPYRRGIDVGFRLAAERLERP